MIISSDTSIHGAINGGVAPKWTDLALLHMIPLLLCASHIAKSLYFLRGKSDKGFRFYLGGAADAVSSARTLSKNKLQKYEGGQEAGRSQDRWAIVEAAALADS